MAEVTRCFTSAKNRYGLRVERLLPSACPYALPRHRSYVTVSGAAVCSYGHKLSLTAALCYAVNPKPPLAFPSCRLRSASLPSSFHPCAILTATFSLPQRLCRQPHKLPARQLSLSVCDAMPAPGRCTVRRCTNSAPVVGQPLRSLRVCLRFRARAGRHTVLVQAHDKVPVAPLLSTTPAVCSNPDVGTPSSLRSFG